MFTDTVTLFNRLTTDSGTWKGSTTTWIPTVLHGVNLNTDRAAIIHQYGEKSEERAVLNIHLHTVPPYLPPKQWQATPDGSITFHAGEKFDFFLSGDWDYNEPVNDSDYPHGFYQFMVENYDGVYAVSAVAEYSVIPHLEVTGV